MQKNIMQLLSAMTIEQKVGQLFVLAFAGQDVEYARYLVRERHIGGFYLTDDNAATPQQAQQLTAALQHQASLNLCDAPLLLAVDQEGAWGILTRYLDLGPGNLALGQVDDTALTQAMYQMFAEQVGNLGYNCILGPCADVNANPDNPIIGQRSFGACPQLVSRHVVAACQGIQQAGLLACAKHFPGHGDTAKDSHQTLPVVDKSLAQLLQQDLLPFTAAAGVGVDLMMTSHICYPQLDPKLPATLSAPILTQLLTRQLGFDGLVISDSMNMWAMRKQFDPVDAVLLALEAGAHLIMLSEEHYENQTTDYKALQQLTLDGVIAAVRQGRLSEGLLDQRLSKVLALRYLKLQHSRRHSSKPEHQALARDAAQRAVRVLRDDNKLLPLRQDAYFISLAQPSNRLKLVNSRGIGPNDPRAADTELLLALQQQPFVLEEVSFARLERFLQQPDQCFADKPIVAVWQDYPLPGENFDPQQRQRLQVLLQHYPANVLLLCLGPDYLPAAITPPANSCVCSYSSRWVAARALADVICKTPEKNLVVDISKNDG